MKMQVRLFLLFGLFQASAGYSNDEDCYADYSKTFPTDPEIKADKIQVNTVHTFNTQDAKLQFRSRRREIQRAAAHFPIQPFRRYLQPQELDPTF